MNYVLLQKEAFEGLRIERRTIMRSVPKSLAKLLNSRNTPHILFINAWTEWAEGKSSRA